VATAAARKAHRGIGFVAGRKVLLKTAPFLSRLPLGTAAHNEVANFRLQNTQNRKASILTDSELYCKDKCGSTRIPGQRRI
jgi:hypothetical protein